MSVNIARSGKNISIITIQGSLPNIIARTGTITATSVILNQRTNASGVASRTDFNYTSDQPIQGYARKSSSLPAYKVALLSGTIGSGGYDQTATMVADT